MEKDIAAYIKKEMDKRFGPTWHCVVGRNFGSYVTHETRHFLYGAWGGGGGGGGVGGQNASPLPKISPPPPAVYLGQIAVLLFKSG